MAYREPAVRVTQEFVNALPALAAFSLPHVNVGPAFQVVSKSQTGTYSGSPANYSYPGQIAGTFIDTRAADSKDLTSYPVAITLRNVVVSLLTAGTGSVNPYDLNQFVDNTTNIFANIAVGDVIVVSGSLMGNNGSYTVRSKISNNVLRTNETFVAVESGLTYEIRRNLQITVGDVSLPTSTTGVVVTTTQVSLPGGLTYDDAVFGTIDIVAADVLLSYRALRVEKSADVWEYTTVAELQADFGLDQIVPENTVVFGTYLSLQNAAVPSNLLALPQDLLVGAADEGIAYGKAFDVLALTQMYAICVLTQNTAVHTALKSHVDTLSQPNKKLERVGIFNRQIVTTAVVVDTVTTSGTEGISGSGPQYLNLTNSAAAFITDGVVPGMFVNITAPSGLVGRYEISAVNSQSAILLATGPTSASTGVTYFIDKDLQKNDQASVMAAYASSIADRRMVMTWPDIVKIPVGSTVRQLPGYFLNSAVGALTTGLPTQQGLTNLNVAVYSGVVHSTKYFSGDQLNILAGGGVMIFVQDVLDQTALYVRHQLTTDMSAIKFQEYSVTKNVDFIAKFIRVNHKAFIGQYNIVDTTFDDLKSNAKGIITFLSETTRLPKIGGVVKSGKLVSIAQDPVNIDTIIERYSFDIPIPLNNLDITIVV